MLDTRPCLHRVSPWPVSRSNQESVQSIMGATEMRRSKLLISIELKCAIGPATDWTDALSPEILPGVQTLILRPFS